MASTLRAWWYGIGRTPTAKEIEFAATHYAVVVLNSWEVTAMRRLKTLNPAIKVLTYKCLSSTRNYSGAVVNGKDAKYLPSGLGYVASKPEWFALDTSSRRIQWNGYPGHWQMAVWESAYQDAWVANVLAEVKREGWDGILADNDMYSLQWYSSARLKGTASPSATDKVIRDGLAVLVGKIGTACNAAGKIFVPNISESHVQAGRWAEHSRYGGMEENFAMRQPNGILSFFGTEINEVIAQAKAGTSWQLLLTHKNSTLDETTGFACAALVAGTKTCWYAPTTGDYSRADWSALQDRDLGAPTGNAVKQSSGLWSRSFTRGWVVVNPTNKKISVTPPRNLFNPDGTIATVRTLDIGDAMVCFTSRA